MRAQWLWHRGLVVLCPFKCIVLSASGPDICHLEAGEPPPQSSAVGSSASLVALRHLWVPPQAPLFPLLWRPCFCPSCVARAASWPPEEGLGSFTPEHAGGSLCSCPPAGQAPEQGCWGTAWRACGPVAPAAQDSHHLCFCFPCEVALLSFFPFLFYAF